MKKLFCVFLAAAAVLTLGGCFDVDIDLKNGGASGTTVTDPYSYSPPATQAYVPATQAPVPEMPSMTDIPTTLPVNVPVPSTEFHDDYDLPEYNTTTAAPVKTLEEMTDDEVIGYFNSTLNTVKQQRLGFKKSKLTSVLDVQLSNSAANSVISLIKSALLSDTAEETTVNKGDLSVDVMSPSGADYVSQITADDVTSVKVTKNGDNYVIRIDMKDLVNPDKSSAYGRLFDFITVDDVMNTYAPKVGATVKKENVEVDFSGCYAELTVDPADRIVGYTTYVQGTMNMKNASVKKVITINTDVALSLGSTTEYTNFVY